VGRNERSIYRCLARSRTWFSTGCVRTRCCNEGRRGSSRRAQASRATDHLKIGIGYNFTDFSDELTDLSYDDRGVFLNLVGSM